MTGNWKYAVLFPADGQGKKRGIEGSGTGWVLITRCLGSLYTGQATPSSSCVTMIFCLNVCVCVCVERVGGLRVCVDVRASVRACVCVCVCESFYIFPV